MSTTAPTTNVSAPADDQLEAELLGLLLQAERVVAGMSEEKKLARLLGAIAAGRGLIRQVFLFADGRLDPEAQAKAFERAQVVFADAQSLEQRFGKLGRKEVEAFFGDGPHESGSPQYEYRRFGLRLRSALEAYLVLFAEMFRAPERNHQWRGTFKVFLDDLMRHW